MFTSAGVDACPFWLQRQRVVHGSDYGEFFCVFIYRDGHPKLMSMQMTHVFYNFFFLRLNSPECRGGVCPASVNHRMKPMYENCFCRSVEI